MTKFSPKKYILEFTFFTYKEWSACSNKWYSDSHNENHDVVFIISGDIVQILPRERSDVKLADGNNVENQSYYYNHKG